MKRLLFVLVAAASLAACGPREPADAGGAESAAAPAAAPVDPAKGIAWFDGGVDEAFAHAAATGKPIYLYWGAEWCPPCHAIAATVFTAPEFIERSRLFVPVYLDGDEPNAQAIGERFGVYGYPTMIVFDASGRELTRIPGGIDIQAYANILDLTLNTTSSAGDVLGRVMDGDDSLSEKDCRLLAYHSWEQDTKILADLYEPDAFRRMFEACPGSQRTERSILYLAWLDAKLEAEGEELTVADRAEARDWLGRIVAEPALSKANIFHVLFSGPDFVRALTEPGSPEREELVAAFGAAFDRIAADESVYKRERIYTLRGRIRFERIEDEEAPLSDELVQRIREMTRWADETTPGVYERQPIVNALANVLDDAGMDDVAKPLLLAELERSQQPYYFMTALADIEQRAGNTDAAIAWHEKAYQSSRGPATRFQWGYYYLQGLLEMTPEDTGRIQDLVVAMITDIQVSGGIHHRPKAQLRRLEEYLLEWGESHADALAAVRDSVRAVCVAVPTEDDTCESFLERA